MTNVEYDINQSYDDFIASYDHAPEYLYLCEDAYQALIIAVNEHLAFRNELCSENNSYMGMKVFRVIGNNKHINCA